MATKALAAIFAGVVAQNHKPTDGEPAGSLDFSQLHPTLLLRLIHQEDKETNLFAMGDVYAMPDYPDLPRSAHKEFINIIFNAETKEKAAKWYRLAAELGFLNAQSNLGVMYAKSQGVIQDDKEAVKWFRLAAEQGDADAQNNLGLVHATGQSVIQDNVYAHMWWNLAAASGSEGARNNKDTLAKLMTPQDISKAQDLARECVKKNYKDC